MFCLQGLDEGKAWPGPPLTSGNMCVRMHAPDPCLLLSSKRRGMLGTERRGHRRPQSFRNAQLMRKQRGSASLCGPRRPARCGPNKESQGPEEDEPGP